ncbi:hypothetical protein BESB_000680 [Besnoitia besnoiti]|uniref:Ribosome biogenesis protein NOP53 n=1 Tax=Besnoitia besnoiti TaxID=94643 RepID=A0A2A9MND9_BESBE|nr:hypothetical protein BESB_000680 [Besnoitia besnoiti]PFH37726.1 hypothetical protein BESB_000680 [Besnoitia besnoiti]
MAPPSKKQKWRRVDLSSTERHVEDLTLHERLDRLDAADELFTLDTEGCAPTENLTQRALKFVKSRSVTSKDGDWVKDSSCLASRKSPLLQVVSKTHKKQILKALKRKEAAIQNARKKSAAGSPAEQDIWGSSTAAEVGGSGRRSRVSSLLSASAAAEPPGSLAARDEEAPAGEAGGEESARESSAKRNGEAASGSEAPPPPAKKLRAASPRSPVSADSVEPSAASAASSAPASAPPATRRVLTARALKSFDRLRPLIPALQTPGDGESYNPSADAHARALLTAAVCSLEERRVHQQTGASGRTQQLLPENTEALADLLLEETEREAHESGEFNKYKRPVDAALAEAIPPEKVQELTERQKQKLLYHLVHGGGKIVFDADGMPRVAGEDEEEDGESEEGDSDASDEDAETDAPLRKPVGREKKKTQADRNRHMRFLQQQRRRAAKLSSKESRAALARLDALLKECDEDDDARNQAREAREERLKAKIEAAKRGRVKLRLGRNRFVEPPPAVALPEDLGGGSLRTMKAVRGGALVSQVASLHRRGLLDLPPTGGATAAYARRVQKDRARRLSSKKRISKK